MMRMLRTCVPRSGPTAVNDSRSRAAWRRGSRRRGDRRRLRGVGSGTAVADRSVDRLGREPVADPEVRVDVAPARRRALELLAQLADEDVDRAVAVDHRVAPDPLVDLLALEHLALGLGEQLDQLELAAREVDRPAADEGLELVGADLDLADDDRALVGRAPRRACGGARPPRRGRSAPPGGTAWSPSRRRPAAARARAGRPMDWPVQTTTPRPGSRAHSFSR